MKGLFAAAEIYVSFSQALEVMEMAKVLGVDEQYKAESLAAERAKIIRIVRPFLRELEIAFNLSLRTSHPTVAYYAGGNHLFLPEEDVSTIIEYAKRRKTNFIVFNSRRQSVNKQDFPEISSEHEQDLELVYAEGSGEQFKVRIYKVRL